MAKNGSTCAVLVPSRWEYSAWNIINDISKLFNLFLLFMQFSHGRLLFLLFIFFLVEYGSLYPIFISGSRVETNYS